MESIDAKTPKYKPDFQRTEPSAKAQMPVAIVNDRPCPSFDQRSCPPDGQSFSRRNIVPSSLCLFRRNSGVISRASVRRFRSRTHRVEQSKFTKPHSKSTSEVRIYAHARESLTDLVEVRAERVCIAVDFIQIAFGPVFRACKGYARPRGIHMHPNGRVFISFAFQIRVYDTCDARYGSLIAKISDRLSIAPDDVVPTVTTDRKHESRRDPTLEGRNLTEDEGMQSGLDIRFESMVKGASAERKLIF